MACTTLAPHDIAHEEPIAHMCQFSPRKVRILGYLRRPNPYAKIHLTHRQAETTVASERCFHSIRLAFPRPFSIAFR